MLGERPGLTGQCNFFRLLWVVSVITNQRNSFFDRAVGHDFFSDLKERVQVVFVISNQKRSAAGRLEEAHIIRIVFCDIDMTVQCNLRASKRLEEVDTKHGTMMALSEDMLFRQAVCTVAPNIKLYLFGNLSQRLSALSVHGGDTADKAGSHRSL